MFIIKTNNKTIRLAIAITQLLAKYNCTFEETDKILSLIDGEIKMQRRNLEYKSIKNFMESNKIYNADNDFIVPLNFTEEYPTVEDFYKSALQLLQWNCLPIFLLPNPHNSVDIARLSKPIFFTLVEPQ